MWPLLYSQFLQANQVPIPPVEFSASARRIAILVTSESAKSTWDLALRLKQIASFDSFPHVTAQTWFQNIYLRQKTVIELPEVPTPYTLRLEIPYWFLQTFVQIWDATENQFPVTPPGFLSGFVGNPPANGYLLRFDGYWVVATLNTIRTIGNVGSGASIAQSWAYLLFQLIWGSYSNLQAPISNSAGQSVPRNASALLDWNAGFRIALPDLRGRAIVGAGTGAFPTALTARSLGAAFGAENHTLLTGEMPNHTHTLRINGGLVFSIANSGSGANTVNNSAGFSTGGFQWLNDAVGGGAPHNNSQPSIVQHFLISAGAR